MHDSLLFFCVPTPPYPFHSTTLTLNVLFSVQWARYMLCDGSPDPTVPGEINTYMNLWRDNLKQMDIDIILKESELCLSVCLYYILYLIVHIIYPCMCKSKVECFCFVTLMYSF